jgi:hypothetical protein
LASPDQPVTGKQEGFFNDLRLPPPVHMQKTPLIMLTGPQNSPPRHLNPSDLAAHL